METTVISCILLSLKLYETKYSRMDQLKFVKGNLLKT